jgi:PAS domain S-box-containing protein
MLTVGTEMRKVVEIRAEGSGNVAVWTVASVVNLALQAMVVGAGYYVGAQIGLVFRFPSTLLSAMWPPTAILLAALLLTPRRRWWIYLPTVFAAHASISLHFDYPFGRIFWQFANTFLIAAFAAFILQRFQKGPFKFDRLAHVCIYLLVVLLAPAIGSFTSIFFIRSYFSGDFADLPRFDDNHWLIWRRMFQSNVLAFVTITPTIVIFINSGISWLRSAKLFRLIEAALLITSLLFVSLIVFNVQNSGPLNPLALVYLPLPLLLWAAVRFGPGGASLSLLIVSFISIWNGVNGRGLFGLESAAENTLSMQLFLMSFSVPLLFLSAVIKELLLASEKLRDSREQMSRQFAQLNTIYHAVPIGLAFVDTDLRFVSVNNQLAEVNGIPAAEHTGKTLWEILPNLALKIEPLYRRVIRWGKPLVDLEFKTADPAKPEAERHWIAGYYPVKDDSQTLIGVNTVIYEVTERKRAEAEIRRRQKEYEELVETMEAIAWRADARTFKFTYVSREAEKCLGYPIEQWTIDPNFWENHLHPDDRDWVPAFCRRETQEKRDHEFEYRMIAADGRIVWLRDNVRVIVEGDEPKQLIGVMTDVTRRKQIESEQKHMEQDLRDSHARIEDLAGRLIVAQEEERKNIARELHDDLNQQVAALAIGLGKLEQQMPNSDDGMSKTLKKLEHRTQQLSERIRQISHQLHSSTLEHVGLPEALKLFCSEFTDQKEISVTLDIRDDMKFIPSDAALCLYRVAQESLRNVAKHSGAKNAEVRLARNHQSLELRIADHGAGFNTKQRNLRGLGLISIEERVKLLHGKFEVKSQPGCGTELRVNIPLGNCHE